MDKQVLKMLGTQKDRCCIVLFFLLALVGCASPRLIEFDEYGVRLSRGKTTLWVHAYPGDAFEIHLLNQEQKQFPSFAKSEHTQPVNIHIQPLADRIVLINGKLRAEVDKNTWRIRYYREDELLTEQRGFQAEPRAVAFEFSLSDNEIIMGGGERILGMNRRGHRLPLYNRAHYGYTTESKQMYYSLPAVMSNKKYWILYDNSASGFLDIGKSDKNTLRFESVGGRAAYWISADDHFSSLIENYVEVTGKQPMPARWTFGNHASRFGYRSQQQVEQVINQYREQRFPVDSVILDLFWFGPDIKGHMGNLDWDRTAFPDPDAMIQQLHQQGVKTIVITEPFILTSSKRWQEAVEKGICAKDQQGHPRRFDFYFGNTCLIDVFDHAAIEWLSRIYRDLFTQGIAGTWGDLGEPEVHPDDTIHRLSDYGIEARGDEIHNVFGHQWAKLVYHTQRALQPNSRPLIMMRSGFAGSQRYGIVPWTGDVERSWDGLKPQVELSLQMGLFGLAYTHSDLGGFAGGDKFNKELYIRWLQYGVFQPIFRPHAQDHIAPEPIFHDQQTQDIIREFIRLRYRLLPYVYTLAHQHSTTGMPLMRPLFLVDETDPQWLDNQQQYFWGDAFLVKPVTEPNLKSIPVSLPHGVWIDFWSDRIYFGNQTIDYPLTLQTLPVLVKAGSFIPMVNAVQSTVAYSSQRITLHYYADPSVTSASGEMYDDDGVTFNAFEKGEYERLVFNASQQEQALNIVFEREGGHYMGAPKKREISLVIHHYPKVPSSIRWGDQTLTQWNYDATKTQLTLTLDWDHSTKRLRIE
jgi:oligosaccharide 4-alpha-D-glucosyltransferase